MTFVRLKYFMFFVLMALIACILLWIQLWMPNVDGCVNAQLDASPYQEALQIKNYAFDYDGMNHVGMTATIFKNWSFVYFQHVRKTGGTAMVDLFHRNELCAAGNRCIVWSVYGGRGKTIAEHKTKAHEMGMRLIVIEWYPFAAAHYLLHRDHDWSDVLLCTIFRHPVQRVYSDLRTGSTFHCGSTRNMSLQAYQQHVRDEDGEFLIDCTREFQHSFTANVYVKIFSGIWALHESKNALQNVSAVHLDVAKSIVRDFDVVLILEQWHDTSIQLRCHNIFKTELPRENIGANQNKLHAFPRLQQHISELNKYDIAFYEYAQKVALYKSEQCRKYLSRQFMHGN